LDGVTGSIGGGDGVKIIKGRGGYHLAIPAHGSACGQELLDWWNEEGAYEPVTNQPEDCPQVEWCAANTRWFKVAWYDAHGSITGQDGRELGVKFRSLDDAVAFKMKFA
jgi:hypothetical protein